MALLGSCNSLLNQTGPLRDQNTNIKLFSCIERRNIALYDNPYRRTSPVTHALHGAFNTPWIPVVFRKDLGELHRGLNSIPETHMDSKLPKYGSEFGILWEDTNFSSS